MEGSFTLSLVSLIVGAVLAMIQVIKFLTERGKEQELLEARRGKTPAERDSIIVGSAENAVVVLNHALNTSYADNERWRSKYEEELGKRLVAEERVRQLSTGGHMEGESS